MMAEALNAVEVVTFDYPCKCVYASTGFTVFLQ